MLDEIIIDQNNRNYHIEYGGKIWNHLADELLVDIGRNIGKSEALREEIRGHGKSLELRSLEAKDRVREKGDNSLRDVQQRNVSQLLTSKKAQVHNG